MGFLIAAAWSVVMWIASFWINVGLGLGPPGSSAGWGASYAIIEASMVRGGIVVVMGGTRTDDIIDDEPSGYQQSGGRLYLLIVEKVSGEVIWWPRLARPATWSGPYLFAPMWMITVALGYVTWRLGYRHPKGTCVVCGYARTGLTADAACPECGALITDPRDLARQARIGV